MVALPEDIRAYHQKLELNNRKICELLANLVSENIPAAQGKVWHGHPVWFLEGNPLVGYSTKKTGVELLFWSGQSFPHPGLTATGKFKAAQRSFTSVEDLEEDLLLLWLTDAVTYQWDYVGLLKTHVLVKLTTF